MAFRKEYQIKWDRSDDLALSPSSRLLMEQIRHDYNENRYKPGEESLLEVFARADEKKKSTATLFKPLSTSSSKETEAQPADPSSSNGRRKSI